LTAEKACSWEKLTVHLFRHFCCGVYHLATMHSVTDGQTDDIIGLISGCVQYDRL